jgi:hypothetical protein
VPGRSWLNEVGSIPYSSLGRPATAFRATLPTVSPLYCQTLVPSGFVMNFGANSTYFAGRRPSKTFGGSTTWSSTLTRTKSLIFIRRTFSILRPRRTHRHQQSGSAVGAEYFLLL